MGEVVAASSALPVRKTQVEFELREENVGGQLQLYEEWKL